MAFTYMAMPGSNSLSHLLEARAMNNHLPYLRLLHRRKLIANESLPFLRAWLPFSSTSSCFLALSYYIGKERPI